MGDGFNLGRIGAHTASLKNIAKKGYYRSVKLAFLGFDEELVFGQPLKHKTNLILMLSGIFRVNEDVVEVYKHKTIDKISELVVD